MFDVDLAQLIRHERERRNILQADVAKRLRRQQSLIARIESGDRKISVPEFFKLADAIGFDPHVILKSWARRRGRPRRRAPKKRNRD
jgi:transcriptional regulator with XRE-family HTH domain